MCWPRWVSRRRIRGCVVKLREQSTRSCLLRRLSNQWSRMLPRCSKSRAPKSRGLHLDSECRVAVLQGQLIVLAFPALLHCRVFCAHVLPRGT
mmetsp:Transcript_133079/g.332194  ORF Transcript_133079/g.332194 Transcript_133079/m.332194 type:complete len:93 (-) Transcript_133079:24-302(-)